MQSPASTSASAPVAADAVSRQDPPTKFREQLAVLWCVTFGLVFVLLFLTFGVMIGTVIMKECRVLVGKNVTYPNATPCVDHMQWTVTGLLVAFFCVIIVQQTIRCALYCAWGRVEETCDHPLPPRRARGPGPDEYWIKPQIKFAILEVPTTPYCEVNVPQFASDMRVNLAKAAVSPAEIPTTFPFFSRRYEIADWMMAHAAANRTSCRFSFPFRTETMDDVEITRMLEIWHEQFRGAEFRVVQRGWLPLGDTQSMSLEDIQNIRHPQRPKWYVTVEANWASLALNLHPAPAQPLPLPRNQTKDEKWMDEV